MEIPKYEQIISSELQLKEFQVTNVISLIDDLNTVPFISRYRKEQTGNLNENLIREIIAIKDKLTKLYDLKVSVLAKIKEQGKLTPELENKISSSKSIKEVEDYYEPYKQKRKTKADIAIEKGFSNIAKEISKKQDKQTIYSFIKQSNLKYPLDEIYDGAIDIVAQEMVDNVKIKNILREIMKKHATISSKFKSHEGLAPKIEQQIHKFKIYSAFSINVSKIKPYQTLALNRGESLKIISVTIDKNQTILDNYFLKAFYINYSTDMIPYYEAAINAYKKLFLSISNEIRKELLEKAEIESIKTFQENLKKLLMTKPQYGKKILAIDPGYRTGSKIAMLDKETNPLEFSKIYLLTEKNIIESKKIIKDLIEKYSPDTIILGNGTASNETYNFLKDNFDTEIVIVNESGASIYSASDVGNEEFPELDATERGTISIGRRYIDPLAELVKIPPQSIGVGMYQHDVNQKELEIKLGFVIEDIVNQVGINVNTASSYILNHISGLTKKTAKKIKDNAPYYSREELRKILTKKVFQQSIGFLRVPQSSNKFDNTDIHPEQYELANLIIANKIDENNFYQYEKECIKLYNSTNIQTIKDINNSYKNIGKEIRIYSGNLNLDKTITINDLTVGDKVKGIVRNIMPFGVFVDIGTKNNGLIHISQLANSFVKNPSDIVSIGEEIETKIISIDLENGKIQLSLKEI